MKVAKGLLIFLMCIGLLAIHSGYAQEEDAAQETFQESAPDASDETQVEQKPESAPADESQSEQPAPQEPEQEPAQEPQPQADQETQEPSQPSTQQEPAEQPQGSEPAVEPQTQEEPSQQPAEQPAPQEQQEKPAGEPPKPEQQPEAKQEAETPIPPDEIMGLDTVDLEDPQGNWLFKRVWWERAEKKIEQIRALVTQIMEKRTGFFTKRSNLDKEVLDPFYMDIGFKRGELMQKVNDMVNSLKLKDQVQKDDADSFEKAQQEMKELEALAKEIEKINKQDEAVDKALLQLVDQINKLRNYEQQAWQYFKDIARVLDDKKARELFYKIDNAWQNVQKVQEYVEQTFTGSFDALVEDVRKQTSRIKDDIDALKERDVSLYKEIGAQEDAQENDESAQHPQPERLSGWLNSLVSLVRTTFNAIVSIVRWPYDKLVGTVQQAEQTAQARPEMEIEVEEEETEEPAQAQETPVSKQPEIPPAPMESPAPAEPTQQPQPQEDMPIQAPIAQQTPQAIPTQEEPSMQQEESDEPEPVQTPVQDESDESALLEEQEDEQVLEEQSADNSDENEYEQERILMEAE